MYSLQTGQGNIHVVSEIYVGYKPAGIARCFLPVDRALTAGTVIWTADQQIRKEYE